MNNLFLSPHYDDETLFGSYTLLADPETVVCVCFRPKNHIETRIRRNETREALEVLGVDRFRFYGGLMEKDQLADTELSRWFNCLKDEYNPRIVYAPAIERNGGNSDHNQTSCIATRVFGDNVVYYATYSWPGGKTISENLVPFSRQWKEKKIQALKCYKSQIESEITRAHFERSLEEYYV